MHLNWLNKKKLNKLCCTILTGVHKLKLVSTSVLRFPLWTVMTQHGTGDNSIATPLMYDTITLPMWNHLHI